MILRLRVSFPPSISPSCGQFRFLPLRISPPIGQCSHYKSYPVISLCKLSRDVLQRVYLPIRVKATQTFHSRKRKPYCKVAEYICNASIKPDFKQATESP